jgi:VanZ family protein
VGSASEEADPVRGSTFATGRIPRRDAGVAGLLWGVFVVYGSLLPFEYVEQPFALALERFREIPLLALGPGDRADWMANLLLYAPLAFLWLAALHRGTSVARRAFQSALVTVALCAMAAAIEFAQIFFPPRTVSLNDLIAEWLGALIGTATWLILGDRARALWLDVSAGGRAAARALGVAYAISYILLALFPFDFLLTAAEFAQKDLARQAGWWIAPRACEYTMRCATQLLAEILFALPLGAAFATARRATLRLPMLVLAGLLFGIAIELAQLFLASGVSQGASVATKTFGFVAGGIIAPRLAGIWSRLRTWNGLQPLLWLLALSYVAAIVTVLGVGNGAGISWREATTRLADLPLVPFYNYYYTSETRALASLLFQAALYLAPGILLALGARVPRASIYPWLAGVASGILALAVQVERLLHPPQRFDLTDVIIAIAAGIAGYRLTSLFLHATDGGPPPICGAVERRATSSMWPDLGLGWLAMALVLLACGGFIARFPVAREGLALGLVACFLFVLRRPKSWLTIILVLLPTLDLAPWSGRYYLDEFDVFALALFVGAALLLRGDSAGRWPAWLALIFGMFIFSEAISTARGLLPWPDQSFAELGGYQSPLNALRVARGIVWACAFLWLLGRTEPEPLRESAGFTLGMTAGLFGVGLIVLWERIVFTGPFNFSHEYRVAGTFSAISTAGAQIESYLAAATPFAMLTALRGPGALMRLLGLAALGLMSYAVASTASRSAYAGVALSAGLMTLAWFWSAQGLRRKLLVGLFVPAFTLLAWILVGGTYVTQRLADAGQDLEQRKDHWAFVVNLMDADWTTRLLGMGTGQYPPTFLWKAPVERRPATFAFTRANGETFLRLGAGHAVYVEQFVPVESGRSYTVRGRLRLQSHAEAMLSIALCDKWILYGLDCVDASIVEQGSGGWNSFSTPLVASTLGRGPPFFRRPIKFALYNSGSNVIDVSDVRLDDAQGRNILDNGDFAHAGDRWYFSADDHFPWNIFNLFVEIFFEQGWLGLTSFVGLLAVVLVSLCRRAAQGDLLAAAFLSAVVGFLVPGLFDSVIDDPRMRLLLILLLCASVLLTKRDRNSGDKY